MILQTERLTLRPLCMDDLYAVHAWQSDAETQKYTCPPLADISETAEYLEWATGEWQSDHQTYYSFGIVLEDRLIGEIAFSFGCGKCGRCVKGEAAIGYSIHQNFWNRDIETEALRAVIAHCIANLGAEKIKMSCDVEDTAQLCAIKSLGMQLTLENEDCEYSDGRPFKRNTYYLQ